MNILQKLRYMGQQYSTGAHSRGGSNEKHYLLEAADLIDQLQAEKSELLAEIERLKAGEPVGTAEGFKAELLAASKSFLHPFIEGVFAVYKNKASPQPVIACNNEHSQEKGNG